MSASEQAEIAGTDGAAPEDLTAKGVRSSWIVLAVLFAVYLFNSIDRSIFGILAQPIKEEMKLADWQLGFLTGFAFSFLQFFFGFPMAWLADRRNRVTILSVCLACWSVMTAVSGLSANFIQLSLARIGVGVGEAGCLPASHSLITDYFPPHNRTKALAIFGIGFPAGMLFGSIIGGIVLDHWGWRAAFYVVGFPGIALALLTWRIVKEPLRGRFDQVKSADSNYTEPKSFREVLVALWRSPVLRHMIFALTLLVLVNSPTSTFLSPYLIRKFPHLSYTEVGFIGGLSMMLGAMISTFFGGLIATRLAQRDERWLLWFSAISVAVSTPISVIAIAQNNWVSFAVLLFLFALTNATYLAPCYTVLHNSIAPGGRAKAVVIVQFLMGLIGASCGPLIAGIAIDIISANLFGHSAPQGFMAACPGGHAVAGAGAALDAACRTAVVDSTRMVMIATQALMVWPAWHLFLAARNMKPRDSSPGSAVEVAVS